MNIIILFTSTSELIYTFYFTIGRSAIFYRVLKQEIQQCNKRNLLKLT